MPDTDPRYSFAFGIDLPNFTPRASKFARLDTHISFNLNGIDHISSAGPKDNFVHPLSWWTFVHELAAFTASVMLGLLHLTCFDIAEVEGELVEVGAGPATDGNEGAVGEFEFVSDPAFAAV